ncbi:MAG: UDP-N-acetylmuramate--alanine ligase [Sphingomonadales bacterium]|nr:UDP-N-acetylmuramate--alanine ligase [Sphingomonadales bacterium]PIX67310.1 MAG: UDP-N-acetylmuramate--alanine ligase [Sphingomonadales bacterium CG_4_10_14_3_um_filter_58_15]NCO48882.1 UDP-N-acetylmuramate--alanine ligase [Sphingomonadales bacterium]NCO99359.1 UDP-N-acetylmuramate--alanine ligase [Sphingomonadales bacterium]NCP26984.1 UDP-N-acetylmuramate--alanine ligase [Sphingomonadales bacterium]
MNEDKSYYFCGIGGSGMLPLAMIVQAAGARVAGSDRALDQGRLADKFQWLQDRGIQLFQQDGSGLTDSGQILIASAAIEDTVPDVARAIALGCSRMTRAELLAEHFNAVPTSIAVGGTSGKSTVTGMIGWILTEAGLDPTIMNGAVMKNFVDADAPFASSRVGSGGLMVSEVDESDGSIALFDPEIAVLNNVSLDHKSLEELRILFGDFIAKSRCAIWNHDDSESQALLGSFELPTTSSFGFSKGADYRALQVEERALGSGFTMRAEGTDYPVSLQVPGRHNIANALAAIAACRAVGVPAETAIAAIGSFQGLARRFDIIGTANDITVIDDFGHNPDKIAATLRTLKAFSGRIIAFFQPHGFGPIKKMGSELAAVFLENLSDEDRVILCDPVYFGGTVDRSLGSDSIVDAIIAGGGNAEHLSARQDCGDRIVEIARPGDRIVIMGARDDTLHSFAQSILTAIAQDGEIKTEE